MIKIDAFILIGGRSSRMGTAKATLELSGKTLAARAVDVTVAALSPRRITVVAGNSSQFAIDAIRVDVPFIFDLHEGRGPLGGLHAALAYAKTPWIFLLACDYPRASAELIELLAGKIDDHSGAVVPEQADGRIQPLCGFYKVAIAAPVVEEVLEKPRVPPPMHELVARLDPRIVRFDEYSHLEGAEDFFMNVNNPDDLGRIRSECKL